jgi:hypothetical protein
MITKHLIFENLPPVPGRVTKHWRIRSAGDQAVLGMVYFWPHWRKYVFTGEPTALFDSGCLHEIASFLDEQSDLHKRGL